MNASQRASCSSATHSLGWCACAMWPGPQIIVGIAGAWNSEASVPNDTLPAPCVPLQRVAERGDLAAVVRVEAGQRRQRVELDARVRRNRVHRGQEARGVALHFGEQRVGIVERQMAELEIERAVARNDVERGAAVDHADVHGRVRHVVRVVAAAAVAESRAPSGEERDDLAGDLRRR